MPIERGMSPVASPRVIYANVAPGASNDIADSILAGDIWIDVVLDDVYFCADNALGAAVWTQGGGSGDVTSSVGVSVDNTLVRADGTDGKTVQFTGITVDDSNNIGSVAGLSFTGTSSAGLTVKSLTTAQRTAITPSGGELVYDTNTATLWYGDTGSSWTEMIDTTVTASSTTTFTNKNMTASSNKYRNRAGILLESPGASESLVFFNTPVAITVTSVEVSIVGSSPSVTWQIKHSTNPSSITNALFTASKTTTTTSTTNTYTSTFDDNTIPANSAVAFTTSAQSGTVTYISVVMFYTED